MMSDKKRIGIDLGGTKTEAILIDEKGNKIFSKRIPSEQNYNGTINDIVKLVREIEDKFSKLKILKFLKLKTLKFLKLKLKS